MKSMLNGNIIVKDVEVENKSVLIVPPSEKRYRVVKVLFAPSELSVSEGDVLWVFAKAGIDAEFEGEKVRIINKGDVISIV